MLRRRVAAPCLLATGRAQSDVSKLAQFVGKENRERDDRRQQQRQQQPPQQGGGASSSSGASVPSQDDWLQRVRREMLVEEDPFAGQYHRDYFRDPSDGYVPKFAPRSFVAGGEVDYLHPINTQHFDTATRERNLQQHEFERRRAEAKEARGAMRQAASAEEAAELLNHPRVAGKFGSAENSVGGRRQTGKSTSDVMRDAISQPSAAQRIGNFAGGKLGDSSSSPPLHAGLDKSRLTTNYNEARWERFDNDLDESLRMAHGLREKERMEFDVKQRTERLQFRGYDMDRFLANQTGSVPGSVKLPNLTSPSSTVEAQSNVRRNSVPSEESLMAQSFALNTLRADPKLGEELMDETIETIRLTQAEAAAKKEQDRKERFGLGRQGPLVQDSGPDKRTLKRHKNDERLMDAVIFTHNAYRTSLTDNHEDPFERNDTSKQYGVSHLLRTRFDMDRRVKMFADGKADPTERATVFYGKPVQQEIDDVVLRRRGARAERHLDYFKPFPNFRDLRLQRVYRDVEGFPLLKSRPDFLEWELFTRFRAHMQQRRELALRHGLEPAKNETVAERDARRLKLDLLCEATPFDVSRLPSRQSGEVNATAETLRAWFGAYLLPSPTITQRVLEGAQGLYLHLPEDELKTTDRREHVLSSRYLNRLFETDAYRTRTGRTLLSTTLGTIPEPHIPHKISDATLKHFSPEEREMYYAYVGKVVQDHEQKWDQVKQGRRWVASHQQYGVVHQSHPGVSVIDVERFEDGQLITIKESEFKEAIARAVQDQSMMITVDDKKCRLLVHSARVTKPVEVRLDDGSVVSMEESEFAKGSLAAAVEDPNPALNSGLPTYHYNRSNYIETQDVIWEEQTTSGVEGWSPATHADGLRVGLPVLIRDASSGATRRGIITEYLKQPFFNPEPRTVTVDLGNGTVSHVPLADLMIWQRSYYGPERTSGDETRKFDSNIRRYVDVSDPTGERVKTEPHFLDKYETRQAMDVGSTKFRSLKQITEIDKWNRFDTKRPENFRPLSISHRRDYIRHGYMHRYTPWEWILTQEADQPLIHEQIRSDNVGPSMFHSPNRFWRWKARPHGIIRNFENEVRDLFQYVDGVTPWKTAQKIRTYWEVREHHPMPQFNRPEVAIHRNTAGLLPAHMWDTDKKTGHVRAVKDSVKDYQTTTAVPKWVNL